VTFKTELLLPLLLLPVLLLLLLLLLLRFGRPWGQALTGVRG
jgi:hypothetical protein